MRIATRLWIISTITIIALIVVAPVLVVSIIEFRHAKNDYVLANALKSEFIERASYRDRYFLYREEQARKQWDAATVTCARLLGQAETQLQSSDDRELLARLRKQFDESGAIFQRIVANTHALNSPSGRQAVYEELDKRLFSQSLLRSSTVRDLAAALEEGSAQRVEQAYRQLIAIIGLFAAILALVTIQASRNIIQLLRKRVVPLHNGAKAIADGDLGHRIAIRGTDEFDELATSINAMTDKLQIFTKQLEAEISAHEKAEEALRDSEEKLNAVLNAAEVAIAWAAEDGTIEYANPKFGSLFGYTLDDVPNVEQWYLRAYPDPAYRTASVAEWNARVARSFPARTPLEPMELDITCKDGSVRHVLLMGSWAGNRLLANFSDITDRRAAEQALQDSERRYHFLFDNNPMPMWVFDVDSLKFLEVNERAVAHYGYTRNEFMQMTLRDIRPPEDIPELDRVIAGSPNGKVSGVFRHRKKDGTIIDVSINTEPMKYGDRPARIALMQDITERKRAEDALKKESEKNLALLRNASDGIHILDPEGNVIEASDSFCAMLGCSREEVIGMNVSAWDAQFTDEERMTKIREQFALQHRTQFTTQHRRKDGSVFDVEVSGFPLVLDGKPVLFNSSRDISIRKNAEEKLRRSEANLRAILDNSPYLTWLKDLDGRFIAVNNAFFNTTGLERMQDVLGKTDFELWPEPLARKYRADDLEVLASRKQKLTEEMSMDKGEVHWVETFKAPIMDRDGHLLGTTGFAQDITVRKNAELQIRHLAHYDPLTDLPNRALFSDRLQQALAVSRRDQTTLALIFLDLDKFKPINDTLGHHVGDLLLKEAAKRMQDSVRETDTIARIGGDEFLVLLPNIGSGVDAAHVAEKIRVALNAPFNLVGQSLHISSSAGIALCPEHGVDETQLVKHADVAMYHAKEGGRNSVMLYQPDMEEA